MGALESLRNLTVLTVVSSGTLFCADQDTNNPATTSYSEGTNSPQAERQITSSPFETPDATPTPLITPIVTLEPTPQPTEEIIPTISPTRPPLAPAKTPKPTPQPTVIIIRETPIPTPEILQEPRFDWALRLIELTNQARAENNLPAYSVHPAIMAAAQKYAEFLSKNVDPYTGLSHTLDGTPTDRMQREGYPGAGGENLTAGFESPEALFEGLMASYWHRVAILANYQDIGIGCYQSPYDFGEGGLPLRMVVCAQNFGITY